MDGTVSRETIRKSIDVANSCNVPATITDKAGHKSSQAIADIDGTVSTKTVQRHLSNDNSLPQTITTATGQIRPIKYKPRKSKTVFISKETAGKAGEFLKKLERGKENQYTKVPFDIIPNSTPSEYKSVLDEQGLRAPEVKIRAERKAGELTKPGLMQQRPSNNHDTTPWGNPGAFFMCYPVAGW